MNHPMPHGHCLVCRGLLPVERQDKGGKYCCRLCEHVATKCGPVEGKEDECLACGAHLGKYRHLVCSQPCADHLQRMHSRHAAYVKYGGARLCKREGCNNPALKGAYCCTQCQRMDYVVPERLVGVHRPFPFDDYRPTSEEFDAMYDACVQMGVISEDADLSLCFSEAGRVRGMASSAEALRLHTEGPQGMVALRNLGIKRRG
jgi:hypothetical protein